MTGSVVSVSASASHSFSKPVQPSIRLLAGLGVEGDAHAGVTVKHRSRVRVDPTQPNLRQVHLIDSALFADLAGKGFNVRPGDMGENIATADIDLLALPRGTCLRIGDAALVEITGLRNPCSQIEDFEPGLLAEVLHKDEDGQVVRRAGVMSVVREGGVIRRGDPIEVILPPEPHQPLERV